MSIKAAAYDMADLHYYTIMLFPEEGSDVFTTLYCCMNDSQNSSTNGS